MGAICQAQEDDAPERQARAVERLQRRGDDVDGAANANARQEPGEGAEVPEVPGGEGTHDEARLVERGREHEIVPIFCTTSPRPNTTFLPSRSRFVSSTIAWVGESCSSLFIPYTAVLADWPAGPKLV